MDMNQLKKEGVQDCSKQLKTQVKKTETALFQRFEGKK